MIYVAQVIAGVVVQVTQRAEGYAPGPLEVIVGPENVVGIGWTWDGTTFAPPVVPDDGGV